MDYVNIMTYDMEESPNHHSALYLSLIHICICGQQKNDFIRIADNEFAISRVQASSFVYGLYAEDVYKRQHNIYGQPGTEELVKELKTELLQH